MPYPFPVLQCTSLFRRTASRLIDLSAQQGTTASSSLITSRKQILEFFPSEAGGEGFFAGEGGLDEFAFLVLELEDFFFDGAAGDEFVAGDDAGLANAVGAVGSLGFDSGVPPGVEVENGIGSGEVEADAASFEADEEDRDVA